VKPIFFSNLFSSRVSNLVGNELLSKLTVPDVDAENLIRVKSYKIISLSFTPFEH